MSVASDRLKNIHKVAQLEDMGIFTSREQSYAYLEAQGQAPKEKPAFFKAGHDILGGVQKVVGSIHPAAKLVAKVQDQMMGPNAYDEGAQTVYGASLDNVDPNPPNTGFLGLSESQKQNLIVIGVILGIVVALSSLFKR